MLFARVGELSRTTGVPVPTIKFHLREGLLPARESTSPNQARHGERHVRGRHLIRAFAAVGGLPLAAVGKVVEAVEDLDRPVRELLGAAPRTVDLVPAATVGPRSGPETADRAASAPEAPAPQAPGSVPGETAQRKSDESPG
ncbi:MerR family transcriptional regulator [Streptomyces subrutilus]|uniref:MerR family transcriptional regulator n=1 Tax=Streptomyces subrutilus TaxID=36818 RepID=A0A5P2UWT7_9ACTN|nr:MerR family transcriptional regulator [Streptomyces subrutilus]